MNFYIFSFLFHILIADPHCLTFNLPKSPDHSPIVSSPNGAGQGIDMGQIRGTADARFNRTMRAAQHGDINACFDLGVAFSTGANGTPLDLVQAHKWFNLAAINGSSEGQYCRAEIAREMSRADIAEAQRQARAWMRHNDHPANIGGMSAALPH